MNGRGFNVSDPELRRLLKLENRGYRYKAELTSQLWTYLARHRLQEGHRIRIDKRLTTWFDPQIRDLAALQKDFLDRFVARYKPIVNLHKKLARQSTV